MERLKKFKMIADIGPNHNNDYDRSCELIRQAKDLGFWGVKFQLYTAEELYDDKDFQDLLRPAELDFELYKRLSIYAKSIGIKVSASVFSLHWYDKLKETKPDFIKVASSEIKMLDRIEKAAMLASDLKIPLFISNGMANHDDIIQASLVCAKQGALPQYFHCTAKYPASARECQLTTISYYPYVGWSDHTVNIGVILAAWFAGAKVIELHLDLDDKKGYEYQFGHCWTVSEVKKLDRIVRDMLTSIYARHRPINKELRCDVKTGKRHSKKAEKENWIKK